MILEDTRGPDIYIIIFLYVLNEQVWHRSWGNLCGERRCAVVLLDGDADALRSELAQPAVLDPGLFRRRLGTTPSPFPIYVL